MAITAAYSPGDAAAVTGGRTISQVNNNTITAGQPILVHVNHNDISTVQAFVTDSDLNPYRCAAGPRRFGTSGTDWLFWTIAKTTRSGTGLTITVTNTLSGDMSFGTVVFAGFVNPALFVGNGSNAGTSATASSSVNTGLYTTGVVVQGNGVANSVTGVGGGATNSVTDGHGCNIEYIITSSAGVFTPTAAQTSGDWTSVIAFFADAPANPAQTRTRTRVYSFPPDLLVGATLLGQGILSAPQPAASTALACVMNGVGALAATIGGAGALAATMAGVGAMTAALTGTSALSDVGSIKTSLSPLAPQLGMPALQYAPLGIGILSAPQPTPGALSATMAGVGAMTANLTGAGALADVMAGVGALSASLTGAGALSATMVGVGSFTATGGTTLADVGAIRTTLLPLAPSLSLPIPGLVPLGTGILSAPQGQSPISATMVGVGSLTASLTGAGALADVMAGVGSLTANLGGSGALADVMVGVGTLTATLGGAGALSSTMAGVGTFLATLSGISSDVGAIRTQLRPLTLTLAAPIPGLVLLGQGILSAPQPLPPGFMTVAMSGVGTLTATLLGSGALASTMAGIAALSATLGGSGALADVMAGTGSLTATLSGTGGIAATMAGMGALVASLGGSGALVATMAGVGALNATLSSGPQSTMAGIGSLSAALAGAGALSGTFVGIGSLSANLTALQASPIVVATFSRPTIKITLSTTMQDYLPGVGFRSFATFVDLSGNPVDPSNPVVTVRWPDGTRTNPAPVRDSTGFWHADSLVATGMPSNVATIRWQCSGAQITQDGAAEEKFFVDPTDA
jgi:hypothetical protein